jgi:hypothetical protein
MLTSLLTETKNGDRQGFMPSSYFTELDRKCKLMIAFDSKQTLSLCHRGSSRGYGAVNAKLRGAMKRRGEAR